MAFFQQLHLDSEIFLSRSLWHEGIDCSINEAFRWPSTKPDRRLLFSVACWYFDDKKERKIDIWRRTPSCWTHKHIACNEKKVQTIKSSNDTHFSELIICFSQSRSSHGVVDGWINRKSCWITESTVDHKNVAIWCGWTHLR